MPTDRASDLAAPDQLFDTALSRLRRRAAATGGAFAGAAALVGVAQLPLLAGCASEPQAGEAQEESWSQDQGQRNTQMVSYQNAYWTECRQPNTRFGCGSYEIFLKVRVRPVHGVDLQWKKVGATYRVPFDLHDRTAVGSYHATLPGGDEEWHVPLSVSSSQSTVLFDLWYQDGAYHTWVDDNQGEFHVVNTGAASNVLRAEPWLSTVAVTPSGVKGKLSVQIADLDYDKQLVLVGTTDGWRTRIDLGMGNRGDKNRLSWVEDLPWSGFERWDIELDLPGDFQRFEYAIGYHHGVVNGATRYSFWDNNWGQNYIVDRPAPID